MRAVLDASAAIEIALDGKAAGRLFEILAGAEEVIAPELLIPELVNTVWKYQQFGQLDLAKCDLALAFAVGLVDRLVSHAEIYREAFAMSRAHRSRAAYDMFYLALARREDAALLTLDTALKKAALREGIRVA